VTSHGSTAPLAFSGSRLGWADLPRPVRARIAELAGAEVVTETSATSGFSPGFAAVIELADGTELFVKAVSAEQNPHSPELARAEVRAARNLPAGVQAPQLLWSDDDGNWVLLAFTSVQGRSPVQPWNADELGRVLAALAQLSTAQAPAGSDLPSTSADMARMATGWAQLALEPAALERAVVATAHGDWVRQHLEDLQRWEGEAADASTGPSLVHGDLRADNVMLSADTVWLIDWPHATRGGAPWYDLLLMLPSVAMQGGGDPAGLFWSQPTAQGADPAAVRAVLAAITGFFLHSAVQPPPPGIANLRTFQAAQAETALAWLRRLQR
jgi:fructosamine-3-kinase